MKEIILGMAAASLLLIAENTAHSQIKVVKAPAPAVGSDEHVEYDTWTSSWGLRDDPPNEYPLGIRTHKSQDEAVAAAFAHMDRTKGNGALAVTHYLIEGEPSIHSRKPGQPVVKQPANKARTDWVERLAKTANKLEMAHDAWDAFENKAKQFVLNNLQATERQVGDALKEYDNRIALAYKEVAELKNDMKSLTGSITEKQFNDVNRLINNYNIYQKTLDQYKEGPMAARVALVSVPPLAQIQPNDLKAKIVPDKSIKAPSKTNPPGKQTDDANKRIGYDDDAPKAADKAAAAKKAAADKAAAKKSRQRDLDAYNADKAAYQRDRTAYDNEVLTTYNPLLTAYRTELEAYSRDVQTHNAELRAHNSEVAAFNALSPEQRSREEADRINRNADAFDRAIPALQQRKSALDQKKADLDQRRTALDARKTALDSRFAELERRRAELSKREDAAGF